MVELPLGFGMALAQNEAAMRAFEALPETGKREMVERARSAASKSELRKLVAGLLPHELLIF